jgi:hypothetical protein
MNYLNYLTYGQLGKFLSVIVVGVIAIALLVITTAGITKFEQIQQQAAVNDLINRYGATARDRCAPPTLLEGPLSNATNRFVVIDTSNQIVYQPYQDALGASGAANSAQDLTAVICVKPNPVLVETCPYTFTDSTYVFNKYRYRSDITLYLIDIQTGKYASTTTLTADNPPNCPDSVKLDDDHAIYGPWPAPTSFLAWLNTATTRQ